MILIQEEPFDVAEQTRLLVADNEGSPGAVVTFMGLVRDINVDDAVTQLFLEHYPGMTDAVLADIARHAQQQWRLNGVRIVHRVGMLYPEDPIVWVGTASQHRHAAFDANAYIMDALKVRAPFWKKEWRRDQGVCWVEARNSDAVAAQRWVDT